MKKKLFISGMTCQHCVMHVKNALLEVVGVWKVKVDLDSKCAEIELEKEVEDSVLKAAVEDAGYEVVDINKVDNGCCCGGNCDHGCC